MIENTSTKNYPLENLLMGSSLTG